MDIWNEHGIWFLIGLAIFPRIALLLFATTPFGCLAWIGWVFVPHLLVAVLSLKFWDNNPVLVIIAWLLAIVGTFGEGKVASHR